LNELSKLKFIDPMITEEEMKKNTVKLVDEITGNLRKLTDK